MEQTGKQSKGNKYEWVEHEPKDKNTFWSQSARTKQI